MEKIMKTITLFLGLIASVFLLTSCASKHCDTTKYVAEKEQGHTEVIPVEVEQPKEEHHHIDYKGESLNK